MHILITGAAGFIGSSTALRVLERGDSVVGIDNLNDYYDVGLKHARLGRARRFASFSFLKMDIANRGAMQDLFSRERFDTVVHLAAQAGVRYSVENPYAYVDANLTGFGNIIEGARRSNVKHLVFASTSSVYGANTKLPFSERDNVDHPISLYAATKKANELMAHSYAHLFGLPCTGLRFFTVYGPWGRPDMALFKFTANILEGKPIHVFNHGNMVRDFTYIDDIVDGVVRVMDSTAQPDHSWDSAAPHPANSSAPYRIYNIGNNRPVQLMRFIEMLEQSLGRKAQIQMLPIQAGDVQATMADVSALEAAVGYRPGTPVEVGVPRFVEWYKSYYRVTSEA
jgi:UDP-glucuronate 4-epimerase